MRKTFALALCAVVGLAAGCSHSKDNGKGPGTVPTPQPTTGKTGTPAGTTNRARTTTSQSGG